MFGVGIARAWQLLGLKAGGILDELGLAMTPHAETAEHRDSVAPRDRPDLPPAG
jgi:hypothetical protein